MSVRWYYQLLLEEFGPVPAAQILKMRDQGTLQDGDLVRSEAGGDWISIATMQCVCQSLNPADSPTADEISDLSELNFVFESTRALSLQIILHSHHKWWPRSQKICPRIRPELSPVFLRHHHRRSGTARRLTRHWGRFRFTNCGVLQSQERFRQTTWFVAENQARGRLPGLRLTFLMRWLVENQLHLIQQRRHPEQGSKSEIRMQSSPDTGKCRSCVRKNRLLRWQNANPARLQTTTGKWFVQNAFPATVPELMKSCRMMFSMLFFKSRTPHRKSRFQRLHQ